MTWWQPCTRADRRAAALADRHYNRQTPGARQFSPPGRVLVLRHADDALWVSSWQLPEFVDHDWPGAWVCTLFRNESPRLSSDLIGEAVAHTRARWGDPPAAGMVTTFVDAARVRPKRDPGFCFRVAGFEPVGFTRGGLHVLQLLGPAMPDAAPAAGDQLELEVCP